jgi:hypothetical protein
MRAASSQQRTSLADGEGGVASALGGLEQQQVKKKKKKKRPGHRAGRRDKERRAKREAMIQTWKEEKKARKALANRRDSRRRPHTPRAVRDSSNSTAGGPQRQRSVNQPSFDTSPRTSTPQPDDAPSNNTQQQRSEPVSESEQHQPHQQQEQQREDRPMPPQPQYTPPPWLPHVTPTYLPPAMWPEVVFATMNWLKSRDMFYDFSMFISVTQQAFAMSSFHPVYYPTPCAPVSTFA